MRSHLSVVLLGLAALSCEEQLTGPAPTLELLPDPLYVCRAQLDTPVVITGTHFTPLPFDVAGVAGLELPTLTLHRDRLLDGATSPLVSTEFSGRPEGKNAALLSWQSESKMTVLVDDALALAPGLHDLVARDAAGREARLDDALVSVEAPSLAGISPGITCLSQGPRTLALGGKDFLSIGDTQPTVPIGPVEDPTRFETKMLSGCTDIAHPTSPGRVCTDATIELARDSLAPGVFDVGYDNPATAPCVSVGKIPLRVISPPKIVRADPPIACPAEGPREVTLHGTGFLEIDGVVPAVTLTQPTGDAVALTVTGLSGDCEELETFGHVVRRCEALAVVIPQMERPLLDAPFLATFVVTNPEPAGCQDTSATVLTLVPAPTLATVTPPLVCNEQATNELVLTGTGLLSIDGVLPEVVIAGEVVRVNGLDQCEDVATDGRVVARCTQARVTLPRALPMVAPGTFVAPPIRVTNPTPAGCSVETNGDLVATPAPVLLVAEPSIVCLADGSRTVTLTGSGLLDVAGTLPTVTLGGAAVTVAQLSDCVELPTENLVSRMCAEATVELAQALVEPGTPGLSVENPESAACTSVDELLIRVVPPPVIMTADPPVSCTAEGPRDIIVNGLDFLDIDGVLPVVTATDAAGAPISLVVSTPAGCEALSAAGRVVRRCTSLTVTMPQAVLDAPYRPTLTITNPEPAGCATSTSLPLLLLPPPTVADVGPALLCDDGQDAEIVLSGAHFAMIDGRLPAVRVGDVETVTISATDCVPVEAQGVVVELCTRLTASVDPAAARAAEVLVTVTNPVPAGCSDTSAQPVLAVSPPQIGRLTPALLCTEDGARTFEMTGQAFIVLGGQSPQVEVGGAVAVVEEVRDCIAQQTGNLAWALCSTLMVRVDQGSLVPGLLAVTVRDPAPMSCSTTSPDRVTVPPALTIASVDPAGVCVDAGDRVITIRGTGFLSFAGAGPQLEIGGQPFVAAVDDCVDLPGDQALDARSCARLTATIPRAALPEGEQVVRVRNADPSGCEETAAGLFYIVPVPEILEVRPPEVCERAQEVITIIGRNFTPVARVTADGEVPRVTRFIDETRLEVEFGDALVAGTYDLEVSNADGCTDVLPGGLLVHPTPLVFFIDPPVDYNGISIQATIYTTGLDAVPGDVRLLGPNGEEVVLDAQAAPGRLNKLLSQLPAGLAPGEWSVQVTSRLGCIGVLAGALRVTDDLTVGMEAVDPAFVSPTVSTAVTIRGTGVDVGFVSTPRAYLNPSAALGAARATALRAVVQVDALRLTAVVPEGLTPGAYDLIVVNPDATVGLLPGGITVTATEPPVIDAVEPASLDGNGVQSARILGENFDVAAGGSVSMQCRDPATGNVTSANANIDRVQSSDTVVVAELPADQFATGSVCLVIVVNADGASFQYSAVSIKTPAQNLSAWEAQTEMTVPRRALSLLAGRPTRTSRFVYAIGGDDGSIAGALDTVEAAGVDVFGEISAWRGEVRRLPEPSTFAASARIGRFLYVLGGHDGTSATTSVNRAEILDPLETPEVVDLDLTLDEDAPMGLRQGLWHYRISAIFGPADSNNPSGESLPGEALVVQLPALPGLHLTLEWTSIPGAVGYRIYRTEAAGDGVDTVKLLDEVDAVSLRYTDAGFDVTPDLVPLQNGSLGAWAGVGALSTPREAASAVAVRGALAGRWHLLVFGGRDSIGVLNTWESATVDIGPTGAQAVTPFVPSASPFGAGRAEHTVVAVTNADARAVPAGRTVIFVGPGRTDGGYTRAVNFAELLPDGGLTAFTQTDSVSGDLAGYAGGSANGFLFAFGGRSGPTDGGISAELCITSQNPGCNQAPGEPGDLRSWNNLGVRLTEPRVYAGMAQESAFFFVAGGFNGMAVSRTVDRTVQ